MDFDTIYKIVLSLQTHFEKLTVIGGLGALESGQLPRDVDLYLDIEPFKFRHAMQGVLEKNNIEFMRQASPYGIDQYFIWKQDSGIYLIDVLYGRNSLRTRDVFLGKRSNINYFYTKMGFRSCSTTYFFKNIYKTIACEQFHILEHKLSEFNRIFGLSFTEKDVLQMVQSGNYHLKVDAQSILHLDRSPILGKYLGLKAIVGNVCLVNMLNVVLIFCRNADEFGQKLQLRSNDQVDFRILNSKARRKFIRSRKVLGIELPISALKISFIVCETNYFKAAMFGRVSHLVKFIVDRKN